VSVAWVWPDTQGEVLLELPAPASVQAALDAAGAQVGPVAAVVAQAASVGVWGKVRAADYPLREGDRVELYRALQADPKDVRRANARRAPGRSGKM
jgi:putative ubiquitin-RnfH superfamily antitoxin RatB of RatAB toxin-antitoxin module